jgi:UDP-N-acetylglucosamine 2-epimerase (non-hydrolysing)
VTWRVLDGVSNVIAGEAPDAVVVQGDTTTCFAGSLAAFYKKVPVIHLEAGLRTGNLYDPFPEEGNRRLTSDIASLHLAPTSISKANLVHEGIAPKDIIVTGNTVIDALLDVAGRDAIGFESRSDKRMVLVTAHRRESWGPPMARVANAIARLARIFSDTTFLLPAHLNPAVRDVLLPPLANIENVVITDPLDYHDFVRAMRDSTLVLTDSGGVQEEAPSLGKPVLVMRDTTERPEAVTAGTVRLVGTDEDLIVEEVRALLTDDSAYQRMAKSVNPYGDGRASKRCVRAIEHFFGIGARPLEFSPMPTVAPVRRMVPQIARIEDHAVV